MPNNVVEDDIDAEIPNDEAHLRYAQVVSEYLIKVTPATWWDRSVIDDVTASLKRRVVDTEIFYEPFKFMDEREKNDDGNSFWAEVR